MIDKKSIRLMMVGLIVAAGGALAVTAALALSGNNARQDLSGDSLITANRDRLRICVQPIDVPSLDSAATKQQVSQAVSAASNHARWANSGYSRGGGPVVDMGCPGEPYLFQPGVAVIDGVASPGPDGLVIPKVEEASRFRLFVFVIPLERLSSIIKGSRDVRVAAQEALCSDHTCFTVTTGIYVTPDELEKRDFLAEWIVKGLNLERPTEQSPGIFQTPGNRNSPKP